MQSFDATDLARALVALPDWPRHQAAAVLDRAHQLGVDPMLVLAGLDPHDRELPYREASRLLGLAHFIDIAPFLKPFDASIDLDVLSGLRSVRGMVGQQEMLFLAPNFHHVAALSAHLDKDETLRKKLCIVSPATLEAGLAAANSDLLITNALQRLARRFPLASAHLDLPLHTRVGFVAAMAAILIATLTPALFIYPYVLMAVTLILAAPSVFRLWAAMTYGRNRPLSPASLLPDRALPLYTILIPLRDEAHMVPQLAKAMRRLDYPPEKLDIKFVVESASPRTVTAVRSILGDRRFSLVVVPRHRPFTKPKALNFALPLARGEHVVVYDAEDLPEPGQLRAAASLFAAEPSLECLQGELIINNASRGWITRMFAGEYAGHFGVFLPAVGRAGFPMPLGGTSNHFRTATLRRIGAWDAFNVTEDADLGIRMARLNLRVESLATSTWEEAPDTIDNWIRQRSRWIKGWVQTLLVHSARPARLRADLGWASLLAFYVFVGGMILSLAAHGLFLISTLGRLAYELAAFGAPGFWTLAGLMALLLGYGGAAAVSIIGLQRIDRPDLMPSVVGLPLYWLLAWYAMMRACYELLFRPYYWSKTEHRGLAKQAVRHAPSEWVSEGQAARDTKVSL
ncbi:MAG TPA: glycosyltransferase family 2 protein [Pelagibacterium sp.]|uniref:glycosyltransferase family 2 protein n=1 Tax=Pelagibacterium sp. TaxID=1967288 RepID=UPI002CD63C7E|nr:glycosyltransferase family 2 protein [Pelagibacterium sp.]HWJ88993.1 glycosyltransferase family 2 protein [Pelagibacterium sp.]